MSFIIFAISTVIALFLIHLGLIRRIKKWVAEGKYFVAVPEKEVVCISKSGGPVSMYLASLKGEGLQIDRYTGEICSGEASIGFWERHYGAEWIGLGGQVVEVAHATVGEDGKVTSAMLSSSRFVDDITVWVKKVETLDGIFPIDMKIEVTVRFYNMSTVLRYKEGYQKKVDTLIKAAVNEFAKEKTPQYMLGLKNEKPDDDIGRSDFMKLIMSLNTGRVGNISLTELVGVYIIAVSIADADPSSTELRKLMEAKKTAEMEGEAAIARAIKKAEEAKFAAEGEGNAAIAKAVKKAEEAKIAAEGEAVATEAKAKGEAKALKIINIAKATGLKNKLGVLGGNTEALVAQETAEAIREFNAKGGGTLAINAPVAIGLSSKKGG